MQAALHAPAAAFQINWTAEDHCRLFCTADEAPHINARRRPFMAERQNSARLHAEDWFADFTAVQLVVTKYFSQKWLKNRFKSLSWLKKPKWRYYFYTHRQQNWIPESLGDSDDNKAKRENTASAFESRGWLMARDAFLQNFVLTERKWTYK